jgi:glucose-1-phosphate cytidylyltransferase
MKAVILAGGLGTRLSEETESRPKPMVEIGNRPMLWHIMKVFFSHGVDEFIICCGYKGYLIKEYFANYSLHMSDVTFDMRNNSTSVHQSQAEPWKVTVVDTGDQTMTGGRLKRVAKYLKNDEAFCFTYGDGVADVDVTALIAFHKQHGKLATVTATRPQGRFGSLRIGGANKVEAFKEKIEGSEDWINGGFFVLSPTVIDRIAGDATAWEEEPVEGLAADGQLVAYKHEGFWQPMDTLREKRLLENLWLNGEAPWKVW